ncbi:SPEAR2 [Fagus crenata]
MDQVDQTQKCSNSSSGGGDGGVARSSKKPKQKKVPQRGLGVAQLEKIRLEEQQKKATSSILSPPPPPSSVSSPTKSSILSLPIHSNPSSSSIPIPDLSSPNFIIRPPQPVQNIIDVRNSSTLPLLPKLWNSYDYNNLEKETSGVDPGFAFRSNLNLPYESDNPIWPIPGFMPRTQQYQHPSHSMMNVSSGTSSSSSVINFQMEPPSNQSYYGNYTPMWPEEERMVGMKRPYPFSLDNPPAPSFNYKFPTLVGPIRSDESASCGNGGTFNFEASDTILREGPSCSTSNSKLNDSKKRENEVLYGDFLTLAPPTTISTCPSSKFKHPSALLASHNHKFPDFESLPYQGSMEDPIIQAGLSQLNQQQPFYSFFPPAKVQIDQATTTMNNCNNEVGESVDLNLKL